MAMNDEETVALVAPKVVTFGANSRAAAGPEHVRWSRAVLALIEDMGLASKLRKPRNGGDTYFAG
jgi:catalase (peroxidase I)